MPGTERRARSRSGSKATTVALARLPSVRTTSVEVLPATTWALVATSSVSTTKPLPSCSRPQASPSTRTVDAATRSDTARGMPVWAGGSPRSGAGRRASKTCGKRSSPTNWPRVAKVSGGAGRTALTARATLEFRARSAGHPGTLAMVGSVSHSSRRTPTTPATAPTVLSTVRAEPSGIATRNRPPTRSPRAWPRNPPPTRRATTAKKAWVSLAEPKRSRAAGRIRAARYTPATIPIHDEARATKPSRHAATPADRADTRMRTSSAFIRPVSPGRGRGSGTRCGPPCGGPGEPRGPPRARSAGGSRRSRSRRTRRGRGPGGAG